MILIFSAPSGAGKSTLVNYLLSKNPNLEFSISATSRKPRGQEQNGKEYYFISADEFRRRVQNDEFVEYEEVYPDLFYGTLKAEVERIESKKHHVVFDVDVKGGVNLKRIFGDRALSLFIAPPSVDVLRERLIHRATDSAEMIEQRVGKAAQELTFAPQFDRVIVNDDLSSAKAQLEKEVYGFLK